MARRKTHSDLLREYNDAVDKVNSLEARIYKRAKEMVKEQPHIVIGVKPDKEGTTITVKEYLETYELYMSSNDNYDNKFLMDAFLKIIKRIELFNQEQSKVKQGVLKGFNS